MGMQGDFFQLLKEQGYTLGVTDGGGDRSCADERHDDFSLQVS